MEDSYVTRGAVIRQIHDKFNTRVTADAVDAIMDQINDNCDAMIAQAKDLANHANRTTINQSDVKLMANIL